MEERVVRILVEVVGLVREVREAREDLAAMAAADVSRGGRVEVVLGWVVVGVLVGVGHVVQGWWGRRGGQQRDREGLDEALTEVVTVGRTEEATVAPAVVPVVSGEGDLEQVEVVQEGGRPRAEGVEGRGGRREEGRGGGGEWWRCHLVSRL